MRDVAAASPQGDPLRDVGAGAAAVPRPRRGGFVVRNASALSLGQPVWVL